MKLVIDIPDYVYEHAKEKTVDSRDEGIAMDAIAKGLHLQQHNGGLIEEEGKRWSITYHTGIIEVVDKNIVR